MNQKKPISLIGTSKSLQEMLKKIVGVAKTDLPVLLTGEIGSGLEEVAREIHAQSLRSRGPFVTVAYASLTKGHAERELFGEVGDESKNKSAQIGKLEFADRGTLFLDQVDRLPTEVQEKLLRVFSEKKMIPVGSQVLTPVDVRVIACFGPNIDPASEKSSFLKDLFDFLNASPLSVPSLRERREDIPELIEYFLKIANQKAKVPVKNIQKEAIQFLTQYAWPGNLKELENSVEMMAIFAGKDTLTLEDIPLDILVKQIDLAKTKEEAKLSLKRVRRQFERQYIRKVLERTRGNQTRTAATLGLHRNTLIWKLKE
ncbi:MAG TPA: sigma 54-interacting transcriptional regulator, partial [bacterium]